MIALKKEPHRDNVAALHGLRGLAVLYVVVSHLGNEGLFLFPFHHDFIGKVGVWIFFSLSAFLLTGNLLTSLAEGSEKSLTLKRYAIGRVFRIYPLYLLVLALHYTLRDISLIGVARHLILIRSFGELWAIPVEFQYYFLIPCVALLSLALSRTAIKLIFFVLVLASVLFGVFHPANVFSNALSIFPKLVPFIAGSALAVFTADPVRLRVITASRTHWSLTALSCLGLALMTVLFRQLMLGTLPLWWAPWISVGLSLTVAGLIYCSFTMNRLQVILASPPLIYLGKISFSVYLLHMFMVRLIPLLVHAPGAVQAWLALLLSLLIASISYRYIEQPGISFGKRLAGQLRETSTRHA